MKPGAPTHSGRPVDSLLEIKQISKSRGIRGALKLSQPEFAARLECGLTSSRRWEYSDRLPTNKGVLKRLKAAAREAGMTLDAANGSNGHSANAQAADVAARRRRADAQDARARRLSELLEGLRCPDTRTRNAAIIALSKAGARTKAQLKKAVAEAVEANPLPADELADWRALQGEPFHFPEEEGAAGESGAATATAQAAR